jgi:hypothetical protein
MPAEMTAEIVPFGDPAAVRVGIENAAPVPPAPAEAEGDGNKGKGGGPPPEGLPADCPVTPLGISSDGSTFFYLDPGNRLQTKQGKDHSRLGILTLFNDRWQVLQDYWPRLSKIVDTKTKEIEWQVTGWKPERAAEELIAACARRGTLNIADRVRGPGAWRARNEVLILHCGDRVLIGGEWRKPGEIDGAIYPAHAATPLPADTFAPGGSRGPAAEALELFRCWRWTQPEIAPHLLLGALGAAKIGGALRWRPTMWLTGDFGTGKSTLLKYLCGLFGEGGVHITVDATPAGIWQRTRQSSHPVLIDEAEAECDPRRMAGMVKLARAASSGGVVWRGGSEHAPVHFTIQGCFVFGSILIPGLTPQDRSRITVLELAPLTGIKPPAISAAKLKTMGEALTRRLVDGWPRLEEVFEQYRNALAQHGHRARSADQLGILLACAHLMLHDGGLPDSDYLEMWCERLPPEREAAKDHQHCIVHLLTASLDPYRSGGRRTVAQWIEDALLPPSMGQPAPVGEANKTLETYGLAVEILEHGSAAGERMQARWLYVANTHRGLAQLFEGSHWVGSSGTTNAWVQALRRIPGAEPVEKRRFAGYGSRATRLPLDYLLKGEEASE